MLHYLMQGSASASGWTVTTFIALAGAVLSLATLIVTTVSTSRREDRKWARDALSQAFYDFVDAGFRARDEAGNCQQLYWNGAEDDKINGAREAMNAQKAMLRHAQTKVRLLASDPIFQQAQDLRLRIRLLLRAVGPQLTQEQFDQLTSAIEEERKKFVTLAKKAMSLPR